MTFCDLDRLRGLLAIFLPGCVQGLVGNVVEPVLFGEKFDMHEVTVLASLTLWYVLWGVPGAVRCADCSQYCTMQIYRPHTCVCLVVWRTNAGVERPYHGDCAHSS